MLHKGYTDVKTLIINGYTFREKESLAGIRAPQSIVLPHVPLNLIEPLKLLLFNFDA